MLQKIINADDFGISPGVNIAIVDAFHKGVLNSASMMMNVAYTHEAIQLARQNPDLKIGIHINLSRQQNQRPLSTPGEIPLLVAEDGNFKYGFVGLFLLSLKNSKELQRQAKIEIKKQIEKALDEGIKIEHLDSHRHVHMIPSLFSVIKEMQEKYEIPRIRVINENCFNTFFTTNNPECLWDGGAIKYGILKTFYYLNRTKSDTYYYSILHTTKMFGKNVKKIKVPSKYKYVEVATHPSIINRDKEINSPAFQDYILYRQDRQKEYEALLDIDLLNRISY